MVLGDRDEPLRVGRSQLVLALDRPWKGHLQRGRDRRQDVGRARRPPHDPSVSLVRELHEQRHVGDVLQVGRRGGPPLLAGAEAEPLVRGHDKQRVVVEPGCLQPRNQPAEQLVGVAELKQVPLPVLVDGRLVAVPDLGRGPARCRPDRVALARGQEAPGAVREQSVEVPERRPLCRLDRGHELREATLRVVRAAAVAPEVLPAVRRRRDAACEVVRQQLVEIDHARVGEQRAEPAVERLARLVAELGRAEVRLGFEHVHLGLVAEEREQVARVVVVDGQLAGARVATGQQRRHPVQRALGDDALVREPGRAPLQGREVRIANGVDDFVPVEQRVHRELVEDDHDHRRVRAHRRRRGGLGPGERQSRGVRVQQEEGDENQRHGREDGQEQPRCRQTEIEGRGAGPDCPRDRGQEPARRADGPDRLEREQADEAGDQQRVECAAGAAWHDRLQAEKQRGRDEREKQREQDYVRARRPARREELAVPAEQVEQRLGDSERPEDEKVEPRDPEPRRLEPHRAQSGASSSATRSRNARSSSPKAAGRSESMSISPTTRPSWAIGTTISERVEGKQAR